MSSYVFVSAKESHFISDCKDDIDAALNFCYRVLGEEGVRAFKSVTNPDDTFEDIVGYTNAFLKPEYQAYSVIKGEGVLYYKMIAENPFMSEDSQRLRIDLFSSYLRKVRGKAKQLKDNIKE